MANLHLVLAVCNPIDSVDCDLADLLQQLLDLFAVDVADSVHHPANSLVDL